MRLRSQLLFVSLITLALPWAGCQYAREFESALRQSQQNALADSAGAIANVVAQRPALLVRNPVQLAPGPKAAGQEIYALPLPSFVTLDGYAADWSLDSGDFRPLSGPAQATYAAGLDNETLWLFVSVSDEEILYERPDRREFDRIVIDYEDPAGDRHKLLIATEAVGRTAVRREDNGAWVNEPAAQAVWQETAGGYQVEARIRNRLVGARLGLSVFDVGRQGTAEASTFSGQRPGFLLHRLDALEQALADFRIANRRVVVVDAGGWVIATIGDTRGNNGSEQRAYPLLEKLVRRIVSPVREPQRLPEARQGRLLSPEIDSALAGNPDARWYSAENERTAIVVAAHPIETASGTPAAVVLEQTSDAILTLTDRALTRLLVLTLFVTLAAALALVGFATYLSLRIRRLSQAAEQAVSPEGAINARFPEAAAGDEIGDLSRSFGGLLSRLREHTDYLRTLAGKLSHELRTPLAVVQSSLDNLEAAELPDSARVYSDRAREGAGRLRSILIAMSEASRVEQAIEHAEAERFDLRALVEGCVNGYRDVNPDRRFGVTLPDAECPLDGVPELIAQMLDKLVDNAVDFTPEGGNIDVALSSDNERLILSVANEGPPLPEKMQGQLFDSMVSLRSKKGDTPHLGFGLHIARLIAESHGGEIGCHNLDGERGAEFYVKFEA